MADLIDRQAAIDALKVAYWDDNIQSAKDDPCIVDAMTDWAIRQVKALPSAQPTQKNYSNTLDALDCVSRQMVIDEVQRFLGYIDQDMIDRLKIAIGRLPSAQSEIIRCKNCRHNGSFDTDCPIDWEGKEYCSFAER